MAGRRGTSTLRAAMPISEPITPTRPPSQPEYLKEPRSEAVAESTDLVFFATFKKLSIGLDNFPKTGVGPEGSRTPREERSGHSRENSQANRTLKSCERTCLRLKRLLFPDSRESRLLWTARP
jgi:hypothetical protein